MPDSPLKLSDRPDASKRHTDCFLTDLPSPGHGYAASYPGLAKLGLQLIRAFFATLLHPCVLRKREERKALSDR